MGWRTCARFVGDGWGRGKRKFGGLRLAYDVIEAGGTAGAVFNAANEAAVAAFLERKIRFGRIVELVAEALSAIAPEPADNLETILDADRRARAFVGERIDAETLLHARHS